MAEIDELRNRAAALFVSLGRRGDTTRAAVRRARGDPGAVAAAAGGARPRSSFGRRFSSFDPDHAREATETALALSVASFLAPTRTAGLRAALDHAERIADRTNPDSLRRALAMFVTHDENARRLAVPRVLLTHPQFMRPSSRPGAGGGAALGATTGATGPEGALDTWREDPLANEHHYHWHIVYPFQGKPPTNFDTWADRTPRTTMRDLLRAITGGNAHDATAATGTAHERALAFATPFNVLSPDAQAAFLDSLPLALYRAVIRLNDRHGEMFVYMHEQMLARYDAERMAVGLTRVRPIDPLGGPSPDGYRPGPIFNRLGYQDRPLGSVMPPNAIDNDGNGRLDTAGVAELSAWRARLATAVTNGVFVGATPGSTNPVDRETIGAHIEAIDRRLVPGMGGSYGGLHNAGHMSISSSSTPPSPGDVPAGVMSDPLVAIRDPIFWRWHKLIDDISFAWQQSKPALTFADAPPVRVRHVLAGPPADWKSPDLILCRTSDIPGSTAPDFLDVGGPAFAAAAFGGANWAIDPATAPVPVPGGHPGRDRQHAHDAHGAGSNSGGRRRSGDGRRRVPDARSVLLVRPRREHVEPAQGRHGPACSSCPTSGRADQRAWIEMDRFPSYGSRRWRRG